MENIFGKQTHNTANNKNSKQVVKDWNLIVLKARTRLLQLMSKLNKDKSIAYDKLKNYWDKKNKLSPYRNNKQQKYYPNTVHLNSINLDEIDDKVGIRGGLKEGACFINANNFSEKFYVHKYGDSYSIHF